MSDQQQSTTQAFPSSDQQQSSTQAFVKKTAAQRKLYESGNELAAYAAKQINYHIMGYYPITPSTQIAENLDLSGARGEHNIRLIAAEGEHSAAGICYGASAGGGRVFNATSANGGSNGGTSFLAGLCDHLAVCTDAVYAVYCT